MLHVDSAIKNVPLTCGPKSEDPSKIGAPSVPIGRRIAIDLVRGLALWIGFLTLSWIPDLQQAPPSAIRDMLIQQSTHSAWDGFTLIDLGYPGFIICLAASMWLSHERRKRAGASDRQFLWQMLRRGMLLALFAFFFYGGFSAPLNQFRFDRVFFELTAVIVLTAISIVALKPHWQIAVLCLFLLVDWGVTTLIPGFEHDSQSPTRDVKSYLSHGMTEYLATPFWPAGHYDNSRRSLVDLCVNVPPMYGTCLFGLILGQIFLSKRSPQRQVIIIAVLGWIVMNLSLLWNIWLPFNKFIWTASYTTYSAGIVFLVTACFVQLTEIWHFQRLLYPLIVFGRYPLASWSCFFLLPWDDFAKRLVGVAFPPVFGPYHAAVIAVTRVILCWFLIAWWDRVNARLEAAKSANKRGTAMAT